MRFRILVMVTAAVGATLSATAYAPLATGAQATARPVICDMSDQTTVGQGINSQRYPPSSNTLTDMGATDFRVPASGCTITQVNVIGRYVGGPGLAAAVDIRIRAGVNQPNGPNLAPAADLNITPTGDNGFGTFNTILPAPVTLNPGKYWLIFQVRMNPTLGMWQWDMTVIGQNKPDKWRNPLNGWGCGTGWITAGANPPCFNVPAKTFIFEVIQ